MGPAVLVAGADIDFAVGDIANRLDEWASPLVVVDEVVPHPVDRGVDLFADFEAVASHELVSRFVRCPLCRNQPKLS